MIMLDRKPVRSYIEDAAILNFRYVAECMQSTKEEGGVGTDDTKKLAGRTTFDVKTGIVTAVTKSDEGKNEMGNIQSWI